MALTQAARIQTLHLLMFTGNATEKNHISVPLGRNIKQSKSNYNIQRVKFQAYSKDASLCVCRILWHYIKETEELR